MTKDEAKELAQEVLNDPDVLITVIRRRDDEFTVSIQGKRKQELPRQAEMKQT